jgi:hypothetical protein
MPQCRCECGARAKRDHVIAITSNTPSEHYGLSISSDMLPINKGELQ